MTNALLAMGSTTKIVYPLLGGLNGRDFFFSFGTSIPDLSEYNLLSYWMGGAYALKLQTVGLAQNLCSPGPDWLSSVSTQLLGRTITTGDINDLEGITEQLWVKPSESKISSFPAAKYEVSELQTIYRDNNLPVTTSIQWTADILAIDYEHRFFVADGTIIAGSPYRVNGVLYGDTIDFSYLAVAESFAREAIVELNNNFPPAFTLDVGYNTTTNEWLIIEANRAWSSGFYGCDPSAAMDVVEYSCQYTGDHWKWIADEPLVVLNNTYSVLQIGSQNDDHGFIKYNSDN